MRLSIFIGIFAFTLAANSRAVVSSKDKSLPSQCDDNNCPAFPDKDSWTLSQRAALFIPEGELEAGERADGTAGVVGETEGETLGTSAADGNGEGAGITTTGDVATDTLWGTGGTSGGLGDKYEAIDDMTDAEEISPPPGTPPVAAPLYDDNQSWRHQKPITQFQDLYKQAQVFFKPIAIPDKSLFWSSGYEGAVTKDLVPYHVKAEEIAEASKVDGIGLQVTGEFVEPWRQSSEERKAFLNANDNTEQFWPIVSGSMASVSSGKVSVLLHEDGLKSLGVWGTSEFPQLQLNKDVSEIYWIDQKSQASEPISKLVWSRSGGYTNPSTDLWPLNTPFSDETVFPLRKS